MLGDRVHGSVKQTLIYKFEKTFQEGKVYPIQFFGVAENEGIYKTTYHKYKIVFQYSTKVALVDNASVPYSAYDFVHIRDIVCGGYDTDYLVGKIFIECKHFECYFQLMCILMGKSYICKCHGYFHGCWD